MRIPERSITSGIMLLVFLFFLVQAISFGPLARTMPLLISVPGVVFCLAQFVIDRRCGLRKLTASRCFPAVKPEQPDGLWVSSWA